MKRIGMIGMLLISLSLISASCHASARGSTEATKSTFSTHSYEITNVFAEATTSYQASVCPVGYIAYEVLEVKIIAEPRLYSTIGLSNGIYIRGVINTYGSSAILSSSIKCPRGQISYLKNKPITYRSPFVDTRWVWETTNWYNS